MVEKLFIISDSDEIEQIIRDKGSFDLDISTHKSSNEVDAKQPTSYCFIVNKIDKITSAPSARGVILGQTAKNNMKYLPKPFHISELFNAITELFDNNKRLKSGYLFNFTKRLLTKDNKDIQLTEKEAEIINLLVQESPLSTKKLLEKIWDYDENIDTHTLQTHIYRLRQKTCEDIIITTENGYKIC